MKASLPSAVSSPNGAASLFCSYSAAGLGEASIPCGSSAEGLGSSAAGCSMIASATCGLNLWYSLQARQPLPRLPGLGASEPNAGWCGFFGARLLSGKPWLLSDECGPTAARRGCCRLFPLPRTATFAHAVVRPDLTRPPRRPQSSGNGSLVEMALHAINLRGEENLTIRARTAAAVTGQRQSLAG